MSCTGERQRETARDQVILKMAKGVEALLEAHCAKAPPLVAETLKAVADRLHTGVAVLECLVKEDLEEQDREYDAALS